MPTHKFALSHSCRAFLNKEYATHVIDPVVLLLKVGIYGLALFGWDGGNLQGKGREISQFSVILVYCITAAS